MPLQKYSLTPAPSPWDALLDYSAESRQVYAHLVLGRLSERTGLLHIRRKGIERELGLRGSQLDAAFVDLQHAGVAAVSELGDGSVVIALLHYAEIAPTRPNNQRGWLLDVREVPDCDAKNRWLLRWPYDLQLPETTGGRVSLVNHKSITSGSPEEKRREENKTKENRSSLVDKVAEVCALYRDICEQAGLQGHRWTSSGLPKGKALRRLVEGSVKRGDVGDYKAFFKSVTQSDFLMGRSGTWRASLDWLMRAGNEEKVLDGKYSNSDSDSKQAKLEKFDGWLNDQGMYG